MLEAGRFMSLGKPWLALGSIIGGGGRPSHGPYPHRARTWLADLDGRRVGAQTVNPGLSYDQLICYTDHIFFNIS